MVILWFLLGAAAVLVFGWLLPPDGDDAAEGIIKRRYARGEIDRETYERMLDDLYRRANHLHDHRSDANRSHATGYSRR